MLTLRQDLNLTESANTDYGTRVWLLQDAINNKFFKVGAEEVKILAQLKNMTIDLQQLTSAAGEIVNRLGLGFEQQRIETFLMFLRQNNLLTTSGLDSRASLIKQRNHLQPGFFRKMLREYLFMRFHLLNPDRLLDKVMPFMSWVFSPVFWWLLLLNTLFAVYMTTRQLDYFLASFIGYFNLQGLIVAGVAIGVAKILHEFGHACVTRHFGCSVSSMGFALLIFFPVLFTDTTDAWRLKNPRQRALIGAAGVLVELALASICLTLWNFTDEGVLRSAFFILATTTWILTLAINLNPLMRFDGYFVLSDLLGVENLQTRSFDLAKWRMREWLFGYQFTPPERPQAGLTAFAFATWIYRFLLYLGIALIIYNYFFKLLGIFLVALQLVNSLGRPLIKELKFWWQHRERARMFPNSALSFFLLAGFFLWLFIPSQRDLKLPAFLQSANTLAIYSQNPGRLLRIVGQDGESIAEGETLVEFDFPDIDYELEQVGRDISLVDSQLSGQGVGSSSALPRSALLAQLQSKREQQEQLLQTLADKRIAAPFSGMVRSVNPDLAPGQWVASGEKLMTLVQADKQEVVAYVSEQDFDQVLIGQSAKFFAEGGNRPPLELTLRARESFPVLSLDQLYSASSFGGGLSVRDGPEGSLLPQQASYRLTLEPTKTDLPRVLRGTVVLSGDKASPFFQSYRKLLGVWRREAGF